MHTVSEILKGFSQNIGIKESQALTRIRKKWPVVVGESIAAHTFPSYIKGHILYIKVDSPHWMHNLTFFKREMCEKIREFDLSDLSMSIGTIPQSKTEKRKAPAVNLSEKDKDFIEKTTRCLKDRETKEAFESLIKKSLSRTQKGVNLK